MSGKKVLGTIKYLINASNLHLVFVRVLHEALLIGGEKRRGLRMGLCRWTTPEV